MPPYLWDRLNCNRVKPGPCVVPGTQADSTRGVGDIPPLQDLLAAHVSGKGISTNNDLDGMWFAVPIVVFDICHGEGREFVAVNLFAHNEGMIAGVILEGIAVYFFGVGDAKITAIPVALQQGGRVQIDDVIAFI